MKKKMVARIIDGADELKNQVFIKKSRYRFAAINILIKTCLQWQLLICIRAIENIAKDYQKIAALNLY